MKRALVSVTDKTGVVDFCKKLEKLGYEIVSTGGTKKVLLEGGVKAIDISDVTGFPEILSGRVKTLHPMVHGGLLAIRDNAEHIKEVNEHNIEYIDLVCVNLYAFKKTIDRGASFDEAVEWAYNQIPEGEERNKTNIKTIAKNIKKASNGYDEKKKYMNYRWRIIRKG